MKGQSLERTGAVYSFQSSVASPHLCNGQRGSPGVPITGCRLWPVAQPPHVSNSYQRKGGLSFRPWRIQANGHPVAAGHKGMLLASLHSSFLFFFWFPDHEPSCCAPCFAACKCLHSPSPLPSQRKGPDSAEHAPSASKSMSSIDSPANANCGISGALKVKNAAAPARASPALNLPATAKSSALNLPATAKSSASPSAAASAASAQIVSSPAAASGSGLSALLDYEDSDD